MEYQRDDYTISTDRSKVDILFVHDYLCNHSYWAEGISLEVVTRSIQHSFCWGVYKGDQQIGFARVISDYATYAYLADVFIIPAARGLGLSKWLISVILDHPDLQGLRRFVLATKDAHGLYRRFGFEPFAEPDRLLCRHDPNVYKRQE